MKKITVCIFVAAFLLFRPYHLQQTGLVYSGDDQSYFAHACSLVFGQFPSYKNEVFDPWRKSPKHSIGPAIMAAPFVFIFSLLDRFSGSDIVSKRTMENIPSSWTLFGFIFASSVYLWAACFLLYKALRHYFLPCHALLPMLFMIFCQGIPLFVFRRPVFSHVYEFFLQSLLVYLLVKNNKKHFLGAIGGKGLVGIGIIAGLVTLVRYNNIFISLIYPLVLLGDKKDDFKSLNFWRKVASVYLTMAGMIVLFKLLPDLYNHNQGYAGHVALRFAIHPPAVYAQRILHILFRIDWGLVYIAPFILIGIIAAFKKRYPLKGKILLYLLPLLLNFYLLIVWLDAGAWYGYRYFTVPIIPVLLLPLAFLLRGSEEKYGRKISIIWGVIAFIPLLSVLCFEGNNSNLTLSLVPQNFGSIGWGNNTYQLEVWKTLLFHPREFVVVVFKGGLLYLTYLGAVCFNVLHLLPRVVLDKYPVFDLSVMIKTFIIYALPFILHFFAVRHNLLNEDKLLS